MTVKHRMKFLVCCIALAFLICPRCLYAAEESVQDAVENETKPAAEAIPPLEGAIDEASDEAAGEADWPVNGENAMDDQEVPEASQEPLPAEDVSTAEKDVSHIDSSQIEGLDGEADAEASGAAAEADQTSADAANVGDAENASDEKSNSDELLEESAVEAVSAIADAHEAVGVQSIFITIPPTVELSRETANAHRFSISVNGLSDGSGEKLVEVYVSSKNGFSLIGERTSLAYELYCGEHGSMLKNGDKVGAFSADGQCELQMRIAEALPQSGYYTDTLTFTINVVRGEDSDA